MEKFIFEGKVDIETEDGGAAKIIQIEGESYASIKRGVDSDNGMFVKIQSWDERAWNEKTEEESHPHIKMLEGKRIRVTIEVID